MKIVFFSSPGFDYSANQITEGLWLLAKRTSLVDQFLVTNKVDHHGSKTDDLMCVGEEEALDNVASADMVLMSSAGDMKFTSSRAIVQLLSDVDLCKRKLVFLDGHDGNGALLHPYTVALYLKRELRYPEASNLSYHNLRSFTFGVYDFHLDREQPLFDERDYDVAFVAFGGSSSLRSECAGILDEAGKRGDFKTFVSVDQKCQPLSIDEYRSIMRRSKIIISVPGAGLDTLRYWEAGAFGSVLCSFDIPRLMVVRHAPEAGRHCLYFDSWSSMVDSCKKLVYDGNRWLKMRRASDKLIRCHHTTTKRAEQLIELFKEII